MHGINNDTRIFILLADLRYQIKAGHIRHTHIQNTHIIVVSANQLQSRSARCSNIGHYRIRHFIHYLANALQYQTVVIDRQDFRLYFFLHKSLFKCKPIFLYGHPLPAWYPILFYLQ